MFPALTKNIFLYLFYVHMPLEMLGQSIVSLVPGRQPFGPGDLDVFQPDAFEPASGDAGGVEEAVDVGAHDPGVAGDASVVVPAGGAVSFGDPEHGGASIGNRTSPSDVPGMHSRPSGSWMDRPINWYPPQMPRR